MTTCVPRSINAPRFAARTVGVSRAAERVHDLADAATLNRARHARDSALHAEVVGIQHRQSRHDVACDGDEEERAADDAENERRERDGERGER